MAEFLTTKGATAKLEEIIYQANKEIILCSPFLQINDDFYERLFDANEKEIKISFIYGKNELNPSEEQKLAALHNAKKYFCENLHAKCYANEKKMLITSMNFYDFSMQNNKEMGIFITRENDQDLFENAMNELQSIIRHSREDNTYMPTNNIPSERTQHKNHGYCIRCGEEIKIDTYKPYCWDCFNVWAQFGNEDYIENVCHLCGEETDSTMARPLCYTCYRNN